MSEIWMYFHKAKDAVRCNGCAYESPNSRTSPANVDALWTHLSSAHRDVYERSNHYATLGSTDVKKVFQSSSNLPSEIWKYFEKVGTERVRCMLCSHEIAHKHSGRTSSFWRHLKSHHVETYRTTDYFKARPESSTNTHSTKPMNAQYDCPPAKRRRIASDVSFDLFCESLKESFARMDPNKVEEMKASILDIVKAASLGE